MLEPQTIPTKTFREDCVNWWTLGAKVLDRPDWLRSGAQVSFENNVLLVVRTAEIASQRRPEYPERVLTADLQRDTLIVRSIRADYASCLRLDGSLILVPVNVLIKFGFRRKTAYTHILDEDTFCDPNRPNEDGEILNILKEMG